MVLKRLTLYAVAFLALACVAFAVALSPPLVGVVSAFEPAAMAAMAVLSVVGVVFTLADVLAARWLYIARVRRSWARYIAARAPDPNMATYRGLHA